MNWFAGVGSLEGLKKAYKALALKHHPDLGGDLEDMKAINAEYDRLFPIYRNRYNADPAVKHKNTEAPEAYREFIEKVIRIRGIVVELIGSWVWITGETFIHAEYLKGIGMRWSSQKRAWYWFPGDMSHKRKGYRMSLDQIRSLHGATVLEGAEELAMISA